MTEVVFAEGWDAPLKQTAAPLEWTNLLALKAAADEYYAQNGALLTPTRANLYRALELTSFAATKVVILGQDPYPDANKATGLAFSVGQNENWRRDSLAAIADLVERNESGTLNSGDLTSWAQQGVLLLNTRLNHRNAAVDQHTQVVDRTLNWPLLTRLILKALNQRTEPVIFVLWGNDALTLEKYLHNPQHLIIRASHPSQMSRRRPLHKGKVKAFDRSQTFRKIDAWLAQQQQEPIIWTN